MRPIGGPGPNQTHRLRREVDRAIREKTVGRDIHEKGPSGLDSGVEGGTIDVEGNLNIDGGFDVDLWDVGAFS